MKSLKILRCPPLCTFAGKGYGPYGAKHRRSLPTPGLCSDYLRSLTGAMPHCGALPPRRPE
eukprot:1613526-Prymnesium_polylepis.1